MASWLDITRPRNLNPLVRQEPFGEDEDDGIMFDFTLESTKNGWVTTFKNPTDDETEK